MSSKTNDKNNNIVKAKNDNKFKAFFRAFIPKHISNRVVVDIYDFLRVIQHLNPINYTRHEQENVDLFKNHREVIKRDNGFVEDQCNYTDMKYGKVNMRFSGCEIFATYNAMYSIHGHNPITLPEMITEYEKNGMVLSGFFGTSPKAIMKYLNGHGYVTKFSMKDSEYDRIADEYETAILTIYNDGLDIMKAVHTVNVSKHNGKYLAHNVNCNGKVQGPFDSISDMMTKINHGKSKAISLIGVSRSDGAK